MHDLKLNMFSYFSIRKVRIVGLMYFETMQFGQATYRFAVNTTRNNTKVLINLVVDWNRNGCKTFKLQVPKVCNFPYESSYLSHSLYLDDTFLDGNDDRQSIRHFSAFNKQVTSRSNLAYCTALAERYSHQTSWKEEKRRVYEINCMISHIWSPGVHIYKSIGHQWC